MRRYPTHSESLLWRALSARKLGASFRRQVVVGRFSCDFACAKARLVVEVDGGYHGRRTGADARRDAALRKLGWRVLRLHAAVVEHKLSVAVALVRAALVQQS